MNETEQITINSAELDQKVSMVDAVFPVVDEETKKQAVLRLGELATLKKNIIEFFAEPKKKAREAWKTIVDMETKYLSKVSAIDDPLRENLKKYETEVREKIEKERIRLQAEAEARAEAERNKLLKQAENAKRESTKEIYLAQAKAVITPVVNIPESDRKMEGSSVRVVWKARIVDETLLPRNYLVPNVKLIESVVRTTQGKEKIPGVEAYQETVVAIKSK
jgi:hypothetical protein